jgi:uncharacterized protein (TIGR00730 family)
MEKTKVNPEAIKAYEDTDFLKTDVCRSVRLQLEFLRPDTIMAAHRIRSTIVLFGSARIPAPDAAATQLGLAVERLAANPGDPALTADVRMAENRVKLSHYYQVAREFAAIVSRCSQDAHGCEFVITTGGGGGIMEAGNRGAYDVGAKSVGLNISLPFEQHPNPYIPDNLVFHFHYFSIRKMHFLMRAKALCCFPGGYGTMDELFECLTLIQTKKIPPMPVVLFGREFWEKVVDWQHFADMGLICPDDLNLIHYCDTAQEAWDYIREFWAAHPEHPHRGKKH